jgi:hypothetical protein
MVIFRRSQWVGISVLVDLFVKGKRLFFPPGIKVTSNVLFNVPSTVGSSKLIS